MTKAENITFKGATVAAICAALAGGIYRIETRFNDLEKKLEAITITGTADGRIMNTRVTTLETAVVKNDNRLNELEKFRFQVEATLPDRIKIKAK